MSELGAGDEVEAVDAALWVARAGRMRRRWAQERRRADAAEEALAAELRRGEAALSASEAAAAEALARAREALEASQLLLWVSLSSAPSSLNAGSAEPAALPRAMLTGDAEEPRAEGAAATPGSGVPSSVVLGDAPAQLRLLSQASLATVRGCETWCMSLPAG